MLITPHSGTLVNSEILARSSSGMRGRRGTAGVGLDADLAQLLHGVLGGLGLELAGRGNPGHIGQVHKGRVVGAQRRLSLAHGFQEGQRFDVTHGAADFDNGHVHRIGRPNAAPRLMYSWISLVTCGMTCTVLPR
jgi:hypothetical protein